LRREFWQSQHLVKGLAIGKQIGLFQLPARGGHLERIQLQVPSDGGIGVITQALDIADGDQEQIQSPGAVVAALEVLVANQPVVHPAKAWRDLPLPVRSEQVFGNHKQDMVLGFIALGT